ncbi:MAG: hypothetical protein K6F75_09395 [Butyrivibrio sp.]|nr:hypothetical protein [Butyrivibrio sp.]
MNDNNRILTWLVLAILVIYVVSPADFLPGPVDDIIAIALYLMTNRKNLRISKKDDEVDVIDVDDQDN